MQNKAKTSWKLSDKNEYRIIINVVDGKPKAITVTNSIIDIMPSNKNFTARTITQPLLDEPQNEIADILNTPLKDLIADYIQFFDEV